MMTLPISSPAAISIDRIQSDAPILFWGGLFSAALIVPFALALPLDERTLEGVSIWMKPLKFAVSLAVYLLTLAYLARYAPERHNRSAWTQRFHQVVIFCVIGEFAWIGGAAMFGTTSHFNVSSELMAAIYSVMGLFAVTLTAASLVMGLAILRASQGPMAVLIGTSLIATFVTTVIVAGYMSSNGSHFVGGMSETLMPIMGWARDVGDLRVAHFFATHIMHFGPLCALPVIAIGLQTRSMMIAIPVAISAFTLATFWQALQGQPFLPFIG